MKRKREVIRINDPKTTDLLLSDSQGQSVRVHKSLLANRSEYFAELFQSQPGSYESLGELQLDENNLIDLIHYLYDHEEQDYEAVNDYDLMVAPDDATNNELANGDIGILIRLLSVAKKYKFRQLYTNLFSEINWKLKAETAIEIFRLAKQFELEDLAQTCKPLILSWLPRIQFTSGYYQLSGEQIRDIFLSEEPDVDRDCKLNALSLWWTHNQAVDMTDLWTFLVGCRST